LSHPAVRVVEPRQEQRSLPLDDDPASDLSLRTAYSRVPELARNGITFDRAIQIDSIRRCLTNIIEARLRAQNQLAADERR